MHRLLTTLSFVAVVAFVGARADAQIDLSGRLPPGPHCPDEPFPHTPKIVAVADECRPAGPLPENAPVLVTSDDMTIRFATVEPVVVVAAYLDGEYLGDTRNCASCTGLGTCTLDVPIRDAVPPGYYSLTIRALASDQPDSPASPPSQPVLLHYQPRAAATGQFQGGNRGCDDCGSAKYPSSLGSSIEVRAAYADPQQNAFASVPTIQRFEPTAHNTETQKQEKSSTDQGKLPSREHEYRFFAPAHFPLREFGPGGEVVDRDGATIYEGMRFAVSQDGQYDVDFVVGTPAIRTTLQLQLLIQVQDCCMATRWRTVTLPAIVVEPAGKSGLSSESGVARIHHSGYSAALNGLSALAIRDIRRQGSARFGFGVIQ